jgi:hypothetical protein
MSKAAVKIDEPIAEPAAPTIDERVAMVLNSEDHHPSSILADLITEVGTEIERNDEAGRVARSVAVDPRVVDHGAIGRAQDSEYVAHKLRNGLAALQQLHQEAQAREKVAAWHSEADAMQTVVLKFHDELVPLARRAEAAELEYDAACDAIDDISLKIYTYMKRCDEIEAAAPPGEARRLPRPIEGLSLAKFMGRKIVPEAPKVETVDYSLATRVWQTAGPALSHDEIVAADEKRREDEQIWLRNIHQSREDRRMEIEAEIHARTRAAVEQKRNYENGL